MIEEYKEIDNNMPNIYNASDMLIVTGMQKYQVQHYAMYIAYKLKIKFEKNQFKKIKVL